MQKRCSTSSEENFNLSDETFENAIEPFTGQVPKVQGSSRKRSCDEFEQPSASTSRRQLDEDPEEQARRAIRDAEGKKAKIFPTTGESVLPDNFNSIVKIDHDYQLVGSHIHQTTREKIARGKYVDFGKLLPKDRILAEEDDCLELVIKQGRTFWSPVSESVTINGYNRWEQAFRIYSDIFTRNNPQRSSELLQYHHIIHSISTSYTWENVYSYDKEFRIHISKHPKRSWAVILQQAWSMRLRDRLTHVSQNNVQGFSALPKNVMDANGTKINDYCKRYNRGYCKFGASCCFEHRCSYCNKFGHSILQCSKLKADMERNHKKRNGHGPGYQKKSDD